MRYRLTCLSPLLVGDGETLSPIDYMVWKDQVNVLDQRRIFRLLAKGPRLDGYLMQLKKAEKLDFASWGGFAQNYAGRRIPFENPAMTGYWNAARPESLHIPTFVTSTAGGPYLPGSAIKGALRTGMLFRAWTTNAPPAFERLASADRLPRRPGEVSEESALGSGSVSFMRAISVSDSTPGSVSSLKVYMLRVSTLESRGPGRLELGWKQAPRGTVPGAKPSDSTPIFAEMASPGTAFEGSWRENAFFAQPEIARALRWREPVDTARVLSAANDYAARLITIQKQYAEWTRLPALQTGLEQVEAALNEARSRGNACVLSMGWGSGLLSKTGWLDSDAQAWRKAMRQIPLFTRAIDSGLPFPKTRHILFVGNQPAALPGWALLEVS